MKPEDLSEYISALVDKEIADLTDDETEFLQRMVHERPECFGEYQLNLATKLCLHKHLRNVRCPSATSDSIKSTIYHILKSRQATL